MTKEDRMYLLSSLLIVFIFTTTGKFMASQTTSSYTFYLTHFDIGKGYAYFVTYDH